MKHIKYWVFIISMAVVTSSLLIVAYAQDQSGQTTNTQSEQFTRLGKDLTPVGAERAGSADGAIPEWTGGLAKTDTVDLKTGYTDPFANEKPLFTITAQNADQYKSLLNAGEMTLLKRDAGIFRMNVYPTHRTAAYPEHVLDEVKKQAPLTSMVGDGIRNVGRTTVPFPIPTDGRQVMWNHVFRWRGGSVERQYIWAPVAASGAFYIVRLHQTAAFDQQGYMSQEHPGRLMSVTSYFMSPPSMIGLRVLTWEPDDPGKETRERWVYDPMTLNTTRVPSYGYDTQDAATNGMRTADQNDGWNGSPDRYTWKLLGKRELLIGYNAYKLAARGLRYPDIIRPRNLNPDLLRYEIHRVWVVEATAKRYHKLYRRIFYVDEDTWQVAQEEVYNKAGQLTNFGDYHMIQYYDVMVPWYAATINHTIKNASYLVTYLNNMEPFPTRWGFTARNVDFQPTSIRVLGLPE